MNTIKVEEPTCEEVKCDHCGRKFKSAGYFANKDISKVAVESLLEKDSVIQEILD